MPIRFQIISYRSFPRARERESERKRERLSKSNQRAAGPNINYARLAGLCLTAGPGGGQAGDNNLVAVRYKSQVKIQPEGIYVRGIPPRQPRRITPFLLRFSSLLSFSRSARGNKKEALYVRARVHTDVDLKIQCSP